MVSPRAWGIMGEENQVSLRPFSPPERFTVCQFDPQVRKLSLERVT